MTFDEAIKVLGEGLLTDKINFSDSTFVSKRNITNLDTIQIINDLRKEYAPTVEMTKEQKRILDSYREPGLYDGDYAFNAFYEDTHAHRLGMREHNLYDNLTEMQLMQAWLHPETIRITEEKQ